MYKACRSLCFPSRARWLISCATLFCNHFNGLASCRRQAPCILEETVKEMRTLAQGQRVRCAAKIRRVLRSLVDCVINHSQRFSSGSSPLALSPDLRTVGSALSRLSYPPPPSWSSAPSEPRGGRSSRVNGFLPGNTGRDAASSTFISRRRDSQGADATCSERRLLGSLADCGIVCSQFEQRPCRAKSAMLLRNRAAFVCTSTVVYRGFSFPVTRPTQRREGVYFNNSSGKAQCPLKHLACACTPAECLLRFQIFAPSSHKEDSSLPCAT